MNLTVFELSTKGRSGAAWSTRTWAHPDCTPLASTAPAVLRAHILGPRTTRLRSASATSPPSRDTGAAVSVPPAYRDPTGAQAQAQSLTSELAIPLLIMNAATWLIIQLGADSRPDALRPGPAQARPLRRDVRAARRPHHPASRAVAALAAAGRTAGPDQLPAQHHRDAQATPSTSGATNPRMAPLTSTSSAASARHRAH